MTKDEALKLALETLEADPLEMVADANGHMVFLKDKAITAIKEALAQPEQEPVAVKHMMRWVDNLKWQSDNGQHMNIPSGLSSGTCWELAIELENFIKHTNFPQIAINPEIVGYVAPQRTWVGLTAKEKHEFRYSHMTTADFIEDIEAKLKDKNTRGQE